MLFVVLVRPDDDNKGQENKHCYGQKGYVNEIQAGAVVPDIERK